MKVEIHKIFAVRAVGRPGVPSSRGRCILSVASYSYEFWSLWTKLFKIYYFGYLKVRVWNGKDIEYSFLELGSGQAQLICTPIVQSLLACLLIVVLLSHCPSLHDTQVLIGIGKYLGQRGSISLYCGLS